MKILIWSWLTVVGISIADLAMALLDTLPSDLDYLFTTSDYLNAELLAESVKRQFLIIPKELVGSVLESKEMSARDSLGSLGIGIRSEMPDLI